MTIAELIAAATAAMTEIHEALGVAADSVDEFAALDTPENTDQLDAKEVDAFRRELDHLRKSIERAIADANDAHAAMNEISRNSSVISPQFGK